MAFSATQGSAATSEINITPLVDVLLVLMIIFMIAAPVASRTLSLPLAGGNDNAARPPPPLQLDITADGQWRLDGAALSRQQVGGLLVLEAGREPQSAVELRAAADAPYQEITAALAAVNRSGLRQVALVDPD